MRRRNKRKYLKFMKWKMAKTSMPQQRLQSGLITNILKQAGNCKLKYKSRLKSIMTKKT